MTDENLPQVGDSGFEGLKKVNDHEAEYWSARDLQPLLGYSQWRSFEKAVQKAITSCEQSGNESDYHFARARKPIVGGKGAIQEVDDYQLSRFACYLIAQNGDPRKQQIANAQKYFAIQTRRQELSDQAAADLERLELRKQTSEELRLFPVPRGKRVSKIACLASFTTPDTRAFTADWARTPSRPARAFPIRLSLIHI